MTDQQLTALLLGDSLVMCRLRSLIARVAPSDLPVLIEGPTGAGKELVARAIHVMSGRRGAMVAFNVCAIPDSMFEAVMFGHVRGAFTGAIGDSDGYLTQADDGTAFFDEIGGLSLAPQAKLLRALETREYRPVGGRRDVQSAFRVVAATAQSLDDLCRRAVFRDDLRHRLGAVVLRVPPLAARPGDIPLLVRHFLNVSDEPRPTFTKRALDFLCRHDWPGNVRELRALVAALAVLRQGRTIDLEDVVSLMGVRAWPVRHSFELQRTVDAVRECRGDAYAAAKVLAVSPTTVYRRLRRAGLSPEAIVAGATPVAPLRATRSSWGTGEVQKVK